MPYLYLVNCKDHEDYPVPGNPGPDIIRDVPSDLERFAREKGWISEGPKVANTVKTNNYDICPIEVKLVRNRDGTESPTISYMGRKLTPVQTKECCIQPDSLYKYLHKLVDYSPPKEKMWDYFDRSALKDTAALSPQDWGSKAERIIRKIKPGTYWGYWRAYERTLELAPEGVLLRMGFDKDYHSYISRNYCKALRNALQKHFEDQVSEKAKDFDEFDKERGKYDFFGHTVYIDIPSASDLYKFQELIKSNNEVHERDAIDGIYSKLIDDIRDGYRKLEEHEALDYMRNDKRHITCVYHYIKLFQRLSTD